MKIFLWSTYYYMMGNVNIYGNLSFKCLVKMERNAQYVKEIIFKKIKGSIPISMSAAQSSLFSPAAKKLK